MTAALPPSIDQAAAEIREVLGRVPGLSLVRVAEVMLPPDRPVSLTINPIGSPSRTMKEVNNA